MYSRSDGSSERWDAEPFTRVAIEEAFNGASLKWYRDRFHATYPGFDVEQPNREFLYEWGYLVKESGKLLPTRGAVALFGSLRGVRNLLPKPVLDVRFLNYASTKDFHETRWIDRFVSEVNIIETWQQLLAKYLFFMPKTFREIDPSTLERRDAPAGFRVFREAAMNLLIHQDYGDHSRKAVIEFFTDGIKFWNPGDSFADEKQLLEPGEKDVRNPAIAMAIRRIEMCEQAGTGLRMMQREWRALGHAQPINTNDRVRKSFTTFLPEPREALVPQPTGEVTGEVRREVGEAVHRRVTEEVTEQVAGEVTGEVEQLIGVMTRELTRKELQRALRLKHQSYFREAYLKPALTLGLIEMTRPATPNSRLQRYRLTDSGHRVKSK